MPVSIQNSSPLITSVIQPTRPLWAFLLYGFFKLYYCYITFVVDRTYILSTEDGASTETTILVF